MLTFDLQNKANHNDVNLLTSQLNITNESQEVRPFPAGDHKASINRRARKYNKYKTKINKWSKKQAPPWNGQLNIYLEGLNRFHGTPISPLVQMWIKTQTQNINNTNDPQKKPCLGTVSKIFYWRDEIGFTARQLHPYSCTPDKDIWDFTLG